MSEGAQANWVELLRRLAPLLPAPLFDRLRSHSSPAPLPAGDASFTDAERAFARTLQQVVSALDSLHHTLVTFLPRYLLDLDPTPGEPRGELLEGTFIFADVTGFTALTGELSRHGTEGREEMNRLMRGLFAALLDPLLTSGGDLLIFAGDAVMASFPAQPEGQEAAWATRTALRLVRAIAPFAALETPYGRFSLTMSAGVERGCAFAAVAGTKRRMELLVSGGPVQGAMRAEGAAEPGQVIVGLGARPLLPADEFDLEGNVVLGLRGRELDDYEAVPPTRRRRRLSAIFSRRVPDLMRHLEEALAQVERLAPFIPPDLLVQIAHGEDIRQHPPVAVQFANVLGIEDIALGTAGPAQATAVLQRLFVQAQEIVADREGIISQVDPYAQGFTLLNLFGAPTHHEGVPSLAASAALEVAHLMDQVNQEFDLDPPLTQRTGLTYDRIFTGEIGYRHRREYVVAGPAVNLAARLMSKAAAGQVVLDPVAWAEVGEDFVADDLPPIPLKGIAEPVPRFALRGLRQGKGLHLAEYPLVVRRRERNELEEILAAAAAGSGVALALLGETGSGKSRLAAALADAARDREMAVLTARCRAFGGAIPYAAWSELLARWFELDAEAPSEERRESLRRRLAEFDLASSLPALADLLGLPPALKSLAAAPRSDARAGGLFARLQEQPRREERGRGLAELLTERLAEAETAPHAAHGPSVWEVLQERASIPRALHLLLKRQAFRRPTLVVIEDIQWIDPASREILRAVAGAAPAWPLLLLVTARPGVEWWGDRFLIPPLSDDDSLALAALALRATQLEPALAGWLLERAVGNPLFVSSYCRALRDAAAVVVDPVSGTARWSGPPPPLPRSLQELLLAQVGRLDPETQGVLQRAAVIGDPFPFWLLLRLGHEAYSSTRLTACVDRAARRSLVAPPSPAPAHFFNSQSLQEALYDTLSHAQRRAWHQRVGDVLAQADGPTRYERLERIAYHYSRGDDPWRAARFTRLAGDKARVRQADEAALAFYAQTLAVVEEVPEVAVERALAQEGSGDIHALRGAWDAARAAYAVALDGGAPGSEARLRAKLALVAPLVEAAAPQLPAESWRDLSAVDSLGPWVGAAQVWVSAGRGEAEQAFALCQAALGGAAEPVGTLLRGALACLEAGEPLLPYDEFFALFARSCLRHPSGGDL